MQKYTFPSGCTLVYETSYTDLPIAAIHAFVRVGSIDETSVNQYGASHFIEHMCFKGTHKYKTPKSIFIEYDKIGAAFNAYTEKDHTCFTVKCNDKYLETCIHTLADIMLDSVFKKKEYVLETPVLMEEMIRHAEDPDSILNRSLDRMLYSGTEYERPVDDISYHARRPYKKNQTMLTYEDILNYYHTHYRRENMTISIVSRFSFSKIKKMVASSKYVTTQPKSSCMTMTKPKPLIQLLAHASLTPKTSIAYDILKKSGMDSTRIIIGFRSCSHSDDVVKRKDRFALDVLSQIIGGSMSGRLFILLREHNGLTYTSSADTDYCHVGGEFTISATVDHTKLFKNGAKPGLLFLLVKLLQGLREKGVTEEELRIAKGYIEGARLMKREKIEHTAEYNGKKTMLYPEDEFVPYSEIFERNYKGITVGDIAKVIREYLVAANLCIGLISSHPPTVESVSSVFAKL